MKRDKLVWIIAIVVMLTLFLFITSFGGFCGNMIGNYGLGMSGFAGMFLFGWIFMLLILIALILVIVWLVQQVSENIGIKNRASIKGGRKKR